MYDSMFAEVPARPTITTIHYTMKTSALSPVSPAATHATHGAATPHSSSYFTPQPFCSSSSAGRSRPTTPLASPRMPFSAGQPHPPKMSPGGRLAELRSPSPNYFGLIVESTIGPTESDVLPVQNWSPPTSSIKSFGAAIPKHVPLDANPDFETFKRQIDLDRGPRTLGLALPGAGAASAATAAAAPGLAMGVAGISRPRNPSRWSMHASDQSSQDHPRGGNGGDGNGRPAAKAAPPVSSAANKDRPPSSRAMDVDQDSLHDSAYVSSDSKRHSEASLPRPAPLFPKVQRFESPQRMEDAGADRRTVLSRCEDRDPRLSVMERRPEYPPPGPRQQQRSETVPSKTNDGNRNGPFMLAPARLLDMLLEEEKEEEEKEKKKKKPEMEEDGGGGGGGGGDATPPPARTRLLLLDVRSSQNFSNAHIRSALNLCIPTTLLKRTTFNLKKLQQTFQRPDDKERFSHWSQAECLVVYDAHSSDLLDAVSAMNMIKKFTNDGFAGKTYILRGGFDLLQESYPELVERPTARAFAAPSSGVAGPAGMAPVIGGVALPGTAAGGSVPFFSNIRQNVDLADGVGQLDVTLPSGLETPSLPAWLRHAVCQVDRGKRVADKFLHIEVNEQSRMRRAYTAFNTALPPHAGGPAAGVRLSGIEQGGKNRYKDILPFEHARVRLEGRPAGACDYVNASHLKASRTNKRYIATQGPLPATFEDFWSVIWDHDVRVIVMLTAESEGGHLKCHPYWRDKDYGSIRLRLLLEKKVSLEIDKHRSDSTANPSSASSSGFQPEPFGRRRANTTTTLDSSTPTPGPLQAQTETPHVVVRKFLLSHASHPFAPMREITQLHYSAWPDFGTPAQPSHLLALVELANVMQRAALPIETSVGAGAGHTASRRDSPGPVPAASSYNGSNISWYDEPEADARSRPVLVHCSAGCGRTGTFCTVDSVIDMLKRLRLAGTLYDSAVSVPPVARDRQGDVVMRDSDPVSPRNTSGAPYFSPRLAESPTSTASAFGRSFSGSGGTAFGNAAVTPLDTTWVHDDSVDLVENTVEDFRGQRISMVQSLRQFVLCYETVLEWFRRMQEKGAGFGGGVVAGPRTRARSGSLHVLKEV